MNWPKLLGFVLIFMLPPLVLLVGLVSLAFLEIGREYAARQQEGGEDELA